MRYWWDLVSLTKKGIFVTTFFQPYYFMISGGNAVLSLTKSHQYLNYTDTQASTIAALGNAALVLGGKPPKICFLKNAKPHVPKNYIGHKTEKKILFHTSIFEG